MHLLSALLVCLAQTPVGPLDAFRANLSAVKVDVKFVFTGGVVSRDVIDQLRTWTPGGVVLPESPERTITGRWTCDGAAEMLTCRHRAPEPAFAPSQAGDVDRRTQSRNVSAPAWAGFQVLSDGEVQAEHKLGQPDIQLQLGDEPGMVLLGRGPFCWWGTSRFPSTLKSDFGEQAPSVHRTSIGGFDVAVEIYQRDFSPNAWVRSEIYYDPSVGYVPRFIREMGIGGGAAVCRELYLVSVRPCAAGGFVPTEFYETSYSIDPPKHVAAEEFDDQSPPRPRDKFFSLGHFLVTDFKDFRGSAALEDLKGVNTVVARGGAVSIVSKAPLTIDRIRSMLGRKLTDPRPSQMATLDVAELNEFTRKPWYGRGWVLLISALVAFAAVIVLWRKKRASVLVLLAGSAGFCSLSGCTPSRLPDPRLAATIDRPRIIYDPEQPKVPLQLIVRNEGNVPIKILEADGGCACRRVVQSSLPTVLSPGATIPIALDLATPPQAEEERFFVRFQTDHGMIAVPVSLVILARDSFNPEALGSPTLMENEGWEFEVVHRTIFDTEHPTPIPALNVPSELVARQLDTHRGQVALAPQFAYQDTKYLVKLEDKRFGLHKTLLGLKRFDGHIVREIPIVWRRVEYLSTVPDRVILGPRPIRVFLRCPDAGIELTRVLTASEGIKAVVSSPRELTIMLGDDAPAVIDGVVEVGTTAESRPPLRVPVVRYSTSPAKS